MFMATKTITITEDAYERLNALKEDYESFSEAISLPISLYLSSGE